jgi:hypothetical protein
VTFFYESTQSVNSHKNISQWQLTFSFGSSYLVGILTS